MTPIRWVLCTLFLALLSLPGSVRAQGTVEPSGGPYDRLVIQDAMVIPGHGGPAYGPADIFIEEGTIVQIVSHNGVLGRGTTPAPEGTRVIDAEGMYVMPGLIDLHAHIRTEPLPLQYIYNLKLAHGVTTMVNGSGRGWASAQNEQRRSDLNEIVAPRMFPIRDWGPPRSRDPGHAPPIDEMERWNDPAQAPALAEQLIEEGTHVVRVGSLAWNAELFGAVSQAVDAAGGITTVHLPPSDIAVVNALGAAELGVTMIEHHYGYAESSLGSRAQPFAPDFNYNDEGQRFREAGKIWEIADPDVLMTDVVDRLVASGVAMAPTMSAYEANRDINRAMGLPWHDRYTHAQLIDWYYPNPALHAAHHWSWTSKDEQRWSNTFRKWGDLIHAFHEKGGKVGFAADDPYIWSTTGIANVRELQLMHETGLDPLEVIRAATRTSALTIKRPDLGLIQAGYTADLIVVDGNPLENLRFLYAFGALEMDPSGQIAPKGGIRWTIKDGVVFDNAVLIDQVLDMVAESKRNWVSPVPALFEPRHRPGGPDGPDDPGS
ncbi:MAG: amidohydrolase family protein [Longimicrobiales bacterium]